MQVVIQHLLLLNNLLIDLTKTRLPSSITVGGSLYFLKTDYQYWLMFTEILDSKKAKYDDFNFLYLKEVPTDKETAFQKLCEFAFPKKEIPRSSGSSSVRVLDYKIDADLIYAAFVQQYRIDLLDENLHMHWYKFQSLLSGLRETKLTDVMGYRQFDENKKSDFKKEMKEMRRIWELPTVLDAQEQEDLDKFNALFEKKK